MPGFAGHLYVNRGKAVLMLYEKEQPFAQEGSAENGQIRVPKALADFAPTAVMLGFLSCLATVILCVVLFGAMGLYAPIAMA